MSDFPVAGTETEINSDFPYAPGDWSLSEAEQLARRENLELENDHMELMKSLQEYYSKHDKPQFNMRELHDALDEKFYVKGGMKYLYKLFPGGPVAQGARLAGLTVPAGAIDLSFGSVQ